MLPHSKNVGDPIHLPNPELKGGKHHSGRGHSATKVVALVSTALILKHSSAISWAGGPLQRNEDSLLPSPDLRAFQNDKSHPRSFLVQFPAKHAIFFPLPFPTLQFLKCSLPTEYRAIRTFYGKPPPWLQQHDDLPKKVSRHFSIDFSTIKKPKEKKRKEKLHTRQFLNGHQKKPLPTDLVHDLCSQLLKKPDQGHFFPRPLSLSLSLSLSSISLSLSL